MTFPRSALLRTLGVLFVAGALSCIDGPTAPRPLALVTATPEALSLRPLDTTTVVARVTTLEGVEIGGRPMEWRSLDTTIANVTSQGLVTASAYAGPEIRTTAILVTTLGASTDTVPVEVLPWAVGRVIANPEEFTLLARDSIQLNLRLESAAGLELSGRTTVWIADDTNVVQVSPAGRARATLYTGPLTRQSWIVAFSEEIADSIRVTVLPLEVASITISPATTSLIPGQLDTLSAVVRSADGQALTETPLTWSSTDTTIARVNEEGVITAMFYAGTETRIALVIARFGTVADTTTVEIRPLSVARVLFSVDTISLRPGTTYRFTASLSDAAGLSLADRPVTWSASDTLVAYVSDSGVVATRPYGGILTRTAQIVASSGGGTDTLLLTVTPHSVFSVAVTPGRLTMQPLDSAQFTPHFESLFSDTLFNRSVTYTSQNGAVVGVTAAGKVFAAAYTGDSVRTTVIVATSGTAVDTIPVEVLPFAVGSVIVTPSLVTLPPRGSDTLSVAMLSPAGLPLTGRGAVWVSSDTSVVQVSAGGVINARPYFGPFARTAQIGVFSAGLSDTASVTVEPLTAASLQLSAATLELKPSENSTLRALLRSATLDTLTEFPLTWRSTDSTVARVNVEGIVTAQFYVGAATRNALVIVTAGALADTTSIDVTPLVVEGVAIAPQSGSLFPSATFQLDASLRGAEGLLLVDRITTWTSLTPSVATVDAGGLVTASAFGGTTTRTVHIIAASGSAADTITLSILPHPVAAVTATPEALSLSPLSTTTVLATVTAADLTVLDNRPLTWASLNDAVATVDANGLVTATSYTGPAVRRTAIVVTSSAATDTIPVTVTPFAVDRVIATPSTVTLSPDDTTTLTVSLESQDGTILTARDRLWLSISDTAIVTVDSLTGLVTARPYAGATERNADVVVYSEGKADTVAVTISPLEPASITVAPDTVIIFPGEQFTLGATLRSASDTVLVGRPITWTLTDSTVATVNADGVVLGLFYVGPDERTTQVVVENGVLSDTALIRVRALLVDSIAIFPDTQTLQAAQTAQLAAVLRDSAGLFLSGRAIEWTSSDPTRATVSGSGLVRALIAGTVTITATSGGVSSETTITIVPVVTTVRVTPELSTVWIGREQLLSLTLLDTNGVAPTERQVTWTSSNPAIATVDPAGVVTALSTGLVTIIATSEGRADSVSIDVFPEPAAAVTITFDDSWRGVLELAYPVMQELRLRGNVGWITSVDWSGVMNPTELRVLQDAGWSVVSHSMTHPYLTQLTLDSARFELEGSRARIASLGFDPRVFIVPYLDYNAAVLLESAAAGYTYTRCCAEDTWSTDTLVSWPIQSAARHRLAGVDVTNYEGQISSYNFRTADGRTRLRNLLLDVVAKGKFIDVFFHDILPEDVPDLRLTMEILAEFRPYLITYGMLP